MSGAPVDGWGRRDGAGMPAPSRRWPWVLALVLPALACPGCASLDPEIRSGEPSCERLSAAYEATTLGQANAWDVLQAIQIAQVGLDPDRVGRQRVTRGDTLAASSGQSPDGLKSWFSLFVFEPDTLLATRKYFAYVDEHAPFGPGAAGWRGSSSRGTLVFRGEGVLPGEVGGPRSPGQDSPAAVLREVARLLREDVSQSAGGGDQAADEIVRACGLLMHQVLRDALVELDRSPGLAGQLDMAEGMPFSHTSLGGGRIRLAVRAGVAVTEVEVGVPLGARGTRAR
ncbi:MAG: hypothetical protein KBE04_03665 [Phycisphaerae bacterium]|nr:hypothetical protein [Phycisphaerae bacterium]